MNIVFLTYHVKPFLLIKRHSKLTFELKCVKRNKQLKCRSETSFDTVKKFNAIMLE